MSEIDEELNLCDLMIENMNLKINKCGSWQFIFTVQITYAVPRKIAQQVVLILMLLKCLLSSIRKRHETLLH